MTESKTSVLSSFLPWSGPGGVKELLSLAIPMILSEASSIVNVFIEKIILGHYVPKDRPAGTDAGIVSVGWSTISVVFYLFLGVIMYSTSFFSQYVGNSQNKKVGVIFWQSIYLCFVLSVMALVFLPVIRPLFDLLKDPNDPLSSDALAGEIKYSKFMLYCMIAFLFDEFGAAFFAGIERPNPIIVINIIEIAINAVADYLYIIVFDYGYMGAAYGTIFAKFSGSLIFVFTALIMPSTRTPYALLSLESIKPRIKVMARIGFLGTGAGLMRSIELVAWAAFLFFTQRVGVLEVTGSGYAQTVHEVAALVPYGIYATLEILVAHYLGAKQPELARKSLMTSLKVSSLFLLLVVILYETVPSYIVSLFVSDEDFDVSVKENIAVVVDSGATTLRILGGFCHLEMLYLFLNMFESASGDTILPAFSCFFGALVGTIVPGIILWNLDQLTIVTTTLLMIGYAVFVNIPLVIMYLSGKWKTRSLVDQNETALLENGNGATRRNDKSEQSVMQPPSETEESSDDDESDSERSSPPVSPTDLHPMVVSPIEPDVLSPPPELENIVSIPYPPSPVPDPSITPSNQSQPLVVVSATSVE